MRIQPSRMTPAAVLVAAVALVITGCGGDTDTAAPVTFPPSEPTSTTQSPQQAIGIADDAGGTITVADSEVGPILVDQDGITLYIHTLDEGGVATCTGPCAETWPPVESPVSPGDDIDAPLLGATIGDLGTTQATFNGWPLYRYTGDTAAGDVTGQGLDEVWFAVSPSGAPVSVQ